VDLLAVIKIDEKTEREKTAYFAPPLVRGRK
jgi:hypothetical protein